MLETIRERISLVTMQAAWFLLIMNSNGEGIEGALGTSSAFSHFTHQTRGVRVKLGGEATVSGGNRWSSKEGFIHSFIQQIFIKHLLCTIISTKVSKTPHGVCLQGATLYSGEQGIKNELNKIISGNDKC